MRASRRTESCDEFASLAERTNPAGSFGGAHAPISRVRVQLQVRLSEVEGGVMIVCSCNVINDKQVFSVVATAPHRPLAISQIYAGLGCQARCGRCVPAIKKLRDAFNSMGDGRRRGTCGAVTVGASLPSPEIPVAHRLEPADGNR
jgi:bacterioferritin-associated ferredoxin